MNIITRKEAKAQGLKHYYTGKACKHGHVDIRHTASGDCAECGRFNAKNTYDRNNGDYQRKWRAENKDKVQAQTKRRMSREGYAEKRKAYYEAHKGDKAEHTRRRRGQLKQATVFAHEKDAINEFYRNRPEGHHVDHEIPLSHPRVCGLHCMANLQYLKAVENMKKHNSFTQTYSD